jgi:hypothetical protein
MHALIRFKEKGKALNFVWVFPGGFSDKRIEFLCEEIPWIVHAQFL